MRSCLHRRVLGVHDLDLALNHGHLVGRERRAREDSGGISQPADCTKEDENPLLLKGWAVRAGERYRIASPPAIRVTTAALDRCDANRFADALSDVLRPGRRASAV